MNNNNKKQGGRESFSGDWRGNKTFRIYTENRDKDDIRLLVSKYYEGFTLYEGQGIWKGKAEPSLIIEVIGGAIGKIRKLAKEIKKVNKQEAVLIQAIDNHAEIL